MPAALVTGARGGIGPSVAAALADDGWTVATTDLAGDVTIAADLAGVDTPAEVVAAAEDAVGPLTALVTCHTVSEQGGLLDVDAAQLDRHLAANVRGTLLLMQAFARRFRGEPGSGRIVNFTSNPPLGGEIAYAASKGAVAWLTLSAAAELGPRGIAVNAVDPGPTETGWMTSELHEQIRRTTPLGRAGRPADAAALVVFLCSPAGGWISGQVVHSDGGFSLHGLPRAGGRPT